MFDSTRIVIADEEEMEDFHDYEDEEHSEQRSKLDDYEDEEDDEDEDEVAVALVIEAVGPPALGGETPPPPGLSLGSFLATSVRGRFLR